MEKHRPGSALKTTRMSRFWKVLDEPKGACLGESSKRNVAFHFVFTCTWFTTVCSPHSSLYFENFIWGTVIYSIVGDNVLIKMFHHRVSTTLHLFQCPHYPTPICPATTIPQSIELSSVDQFSSSFVMDHLLSFPDYIFYLPHMRAQILHQFLLNNLNQFDSL